MSYLGVGQARSDLVILIQRHIEPLAHLVREQELLRLLPQPLGLGQQLTNEKRVLRALANEGQVLPDDRPATESSAFPPAAGELVQPVNYPVIADGVGSAHAHGHTALLVVPAQVPSPAVVAQAVALGLVHHVAHQVLPGRWSPNSLILTLSNQWSGI